MARTVVVGIHEAKTNLSKLLKRVEAGDEVIVRSYDRPVAKIVPYGGAGVARTAGLFAGQIAIGPDFDELPPGFEAFGD
jgi:prevent-host-death family protein